MNFNIKIVYFNALVIPILIMSDLAAGKSTVYQDLSSSPESLSTGTSVMKQWCQQQLPISNDYEHSWKFTFLPITSSLITEDRIDL